MGIRIRHAENMCCVFVILIKSSKLVDITNVDKDFKYQIKFEKKIICKYWLISALPMT